MFYNIHSWMKMNFIHKWIILVKINFIQKWIILVNWTIDVGKCHDSCTLDSIPITSKKLLHKTKPFSPRYLL